MAQAASEGKLAPPFEAKLSQGEKFSLATAKNQVVVLHYWATWCDACRNEMPLLDSFYKKHRSEGLRIVVIGMDPEDDEAKAHEMAKAFSFDSTTVRDASFKGYGRIWRLPLTFIIDRKGILQKDGWVLDHPMTAADLDQTLMPLLQSSNEKTVTN